MGGHKITEDLMAKSGIVIQLRSFDENMKITGILKSHLEDMFPEKKVIVGCGLKLMIKGVDNEELMEEIKDVVRSLGGRI